MFNKAPIIFNLEELAYVNITSITKEIDGDWVPVRPLGYNSIFNRVTCAWLAFSGKCDLVKWPGNQ